MITTHAFETAPIHSGKAGDGDSDGNDDGDGDGDGDGFLTAHHA